MRVRYAMAAALAFAAAPPSSAFEDAPRLESRLLGRGVDHVLVWTRDADRSSRFLERQLGFRVRSGGSFPGDTANRLVRFSDASFLELLYFTAPLDRVSLKGVEFLSHRNGSNGFATAVPSLEETARGLAGSGFSPDAPTAGTYDPDGPEGPQAPQDSLFRTLGFRVPPLPGLDPFFVWYRAAARWTAQDQARRDEASRHRNGAERLSAVWIVAADPAGASTALARMGMTRGRAVDQPDLKARAVPFTAGRSKIILLAPSGEGHAARQLRLRGAHVAGISVEVTDIEVTAHLLRTGGAPPPRRASSPLGPSIRSDTTDELGLFVEFHE